MGTDILGVQHLRVIQSPSDPYICSVTQHGNGHFVNLCQLKEQSQLFFQSYEIQADKTFKRTKCCEFEINSFDHSMKRTTTLARVFTDYEDAKGYEMAFKCQEPLFRSGYGPDLAAPKHR